MPVRRVATTVDEFTRFADRIFLAELVVVAMQVPYITSYDDAVGVGPGTVANPVARIDRVVSGRAQVRPPGLVGGAGRLGERLAMSVSTCKSAKVPTVSRTFAGQEKAHIRILRLSQHRATRREYNAGNHCLRPNCLFHAFSPATKNCPSREYKRGGV